MNNRPWLVPFTVLSLASLYLVFTMLPAREPADGMQLHRAGKLMVSEGGRFKPLDSFARTQMLLMSKQQDYKDVEGKRQPAIRWLFDTLAFGLSRYYDLFQFVTISNPELVQFLELKPNPKGIYSLEEVAGKPQFQTEMKRLLQQHQHEEKLSGTDRDMFRLLMEVAHNLERMRYSQAISQELQKRQALQNSIFRIENDQVLALLGLPRREGLRYSWAEVMSAKGRDQFNRQLQLARQRPEKNWSLLEGKTVELNRQLAPYSEVANLEGVLLVPPPAGSLESPWLSFRDALARGLHAGQAEEATQELEKLIRAYGLGEVEKFNESLARYEAMQENRFAAELGVVRFEAWFNKFAPFFQSWLMSGLVIVLIFISWLSWREVLTKAALWTLMLTFAVVTFAMFARMYIQNRPPVTNLYSSAVFIAWGAIAICLVLEGWFGGGIGILVGAVLSFLSTFIAHHLAAGGDTLEMMQAVLDTNFWLATHVVCVTLGYVATFVAGFVGIVYTVRGLFTTSLDAEEGKTLTRMTYGLVCFAMLLSFVGTVLGGVWADQSWGRFWGWDPKENGALLIVVMNALILHARWGGMIKDRGIAILAMCGNMITLWSWFGTNQLGIGLHAYGVNKTLVQICCWSWFVQGTLILAAVLIPQHRWLSFRAKPQRDRERTADRPRRETKGRPAPALGR